MSFLGVIFAVLAGQIGIALGLILSQFSQKNLRGNGLSFERLSITAPTLPTLAYKAADNSPLPLRHYPCKNAPLLVMVHGSGWHGAQFEALAAKLAINGVAEVLVPDLRGHGEAPATRGDISYLDQLEDDLLALVQTYKTKEQRVVLLGHSSGGGLVIRAGNGALKGRFDHAILLAPYLKYNAPTARKSSTWAAPLTRRIIGLSMLNLMGIRIFNHLTSIQFRFPDTVLNGPLGHTATRAYSYRMMLGFAPRRAYQKDIAALPRFTLIAGEQDEAFHAERYEETMSVANSQGRYHLLSEVGHLDLVDAPKTYELISDVLKFPATIGLDDEL